VSDRASRPPSARVSARAPARESRTRAVRERILDAAVGLLQSAGKLAQPQVARAAGVPQGHLTYYFPKRFDLLAAVAARFREMLHEELPAVLEADLGQAIDAKVREKALAFVARLARDRARTRMLLGLILAAEEDPSLRGAMADNVMLVRRLLARLLGRDESDPDVDIVLGAFWGIGLQHLVLEGKRTDAQTEAILERMRGWLAAAPPPAGPSAAAASVPSSASASVPSSAAPKRASRPPVAKPPR
jgi:AcrR family transcriptional regulator